MKLFDPFLESDLKKFKCIQLSYSPNIPGPDEIILHFVLGSQVLETKTGYLLLIDVRNSETNEEYTYSFPDIQDVEFNTNTRYPDGAKYYLHCLQRENLEEIRRLKKRLAAGEELSEEDLTFLDDNNEILTYRLIFKN
ncbi:hypothetical protein [Bacillus massiliglaciei]|uniref:hypothetical protein n=1 Tax=Bacillus massiliglaciei TaxID=1816693 RepID=UPI0018FF07CA|nr:hypothetical protein [Bacillus massiliglaciei]